MAASPERVALDNLMSVEDIAGALQLRVGHVRDRLVQEADFPRPVVNRPKFRRWSRASIEEWLGREAAKCER
jgi:predicted DNA-binding transcriptional regulator AlpA